jgi:hypothetical protein
LGVSIVDSWYIQMKVVSKISVNFKNLRASRFTSRT